MSAALPSLVANDYGSDDSEAESPCPVSSTLTPVVCEALPSAVVAVPSEAPASATVDTSQHGVTDKVPLEATVLGQVTRESCVPDYAWPPPLPDADDWCLPPVVTELCDDAFQASGWHRLMEEQQVYFNDRLLGSQAFRNPHLYAKLVEFLDLDETGSNLPQTVFDPHGWPPEAFAEEIVKEQRRRAEERALAHHARTQIQFVTSQSAGTSASSSPFAQAPTGDAAGK
ncbi:HCNGP-like protein-domain-containing protein [Thamnocephalis sphaerospora]|uniref:HCNGP-like protein-domain-containing protein n=1 Tax=Thamnocephalis sphaerospora TaxID=78915 RepID=A0A4P9XH58_9FUNG|nr:HCNGP-like protein-domain-containing protein [Thamnocephalis sphaerospora]|eukprot:RKP04993.1 HCNGP-like protein-domain-containing protein [Thamnocephalis sphaerospora]